MATKVKGKGNVLKVAISSVDTAIPQIFSLDKSGEKSETYSARTFDGPVHDEQPNSGYVSNAVWKFEYFHDSANPVHTYLKTAMRTPPAAGSVFTHIDVSGTPITEVITATGIGVEEKYVTNDGVKATCTLTTSGNPS